MAADPEATQAPTPVEALEADFAPLDPARALEVYREVRAWVHAWSVPSQTPPNSTVHRAGLESGAVCVTLRFGGRVIGSAVGIGARDGTMRADAGEAVAEATRGALREASQFFGLKAGQTPPAADRVMVSVEFAGRFVPYLPASYDDADLEIPAGIEGIAVRAGERTRVVFPSMMLLFGAGSVDLGRPTGMSPGDALATGVGAVLEDPGTGMRLLAENNPQRMAKERGVTFYRFSVAHLASRTPGGDPEFLYRHGRVLHEREVTLETLRVWRDGLANHLLARVRTGADGVTMAGVYSPVSDTFAPRAELVEQGLAAWALGVTARQPGVDAELAARCAEAARGLVLDLSRREDAARRVERTPAAAAAFVLALSSAAPVDAERVKPARDAAMNSLRTVVERPEGAPSMLALVAYAVGREGARAGLPELRVRASGLLETIFRENPVEDLSSSMPWAALAAIDLPERDGTITSTPVLLDWRDLVMKNMMTPADAGPDAEDLVGGIVFPRSRAPLPSAQSVRVGLALAAMLADERLTLNNRVAPETARLVPLLRFVRQLMGDDAHAALFVDPERAKFGVRSALWDQRMTVEACAVTLVLLSDAIRGVERSAGGR